MTRAELQNLREHFFEEKSSLKTFLLLIHYTFKETRSSS